MASGLSARHKKDAATEQELWLYALHATQQVVTGNTAKRAEDISAQTAFAKNDSGTPSTSAPIVALLTN